MDETSLLSPSEDPEPPSKKMRADAPVTDDGAASAAGGGGAAAAAAEEVQKEEFTTGNVYKVLNQAVASAFKGELQDAAAPCVACLGILQAANRDIDRLAKLINDDGYEFENYSVSTSTPIEIVLRDNAVYQHLPKTFDDHFLSDDPYATTPAVKDVLRWLYQDCLGVKVGNKPYERNGELELQLTYEHPETDTSWKWLIKMDSDRFAPRKRGKHGKTHTPVPTPILVAEALKVAGHRIKHYTAVPPSTPTTTTAFPKVTPWLIQGVRKSAHSVEELLTEAVKKEFNAESIKFSASGREDVDVRMLGEGRPFAIELINPRKASVSADVLKAIQDGINGRTGDGADLVGCRDLQMVSKDDLMALKEGEETKSKTYCCVVWTEKDLTAEEMDAACALKDVKLAQGTPVRVAHRRTMMVREKVVHWMTYKKLKPHYIKLWLGTQAGTYIKEFIHGDFGRTVPSFGTLCGCKVDIMSLDVVSISLNWPPKLGDP